MEIQTKSTKNNIVFNLHGDIDRYNSGVLRDIITSKMTRKGMQIVINMEDVDCIDDTVMDVLHSCFDTAKQYQGSLKVVNSHHAVQCISAFQVLH